MKLKVSLRQWQLSLRNSLPLEQLVVILLLSLSQLMLLGECQLVQPSWPELPGVWQLAGDFSLSLMVLGDEAGEEEKGEGETETEKEGGNGGHLEHQWCS